MSVNKCVQDDLHDDDDNDKDKKWYNMPMMVKKNQNSRNDIGSYFSSRQNLMTDSSTTPIVHANMDNPTFEKFNFLMPIAKTVVFADNMNDSNFDSKLSPINIQETV